MPMMMGTAGPLFGWLLGVLIAGAAAGLAVHRWRAVRYHDEAWALPDPLITARERYARGDISKAEFDEMTDRLLRTESPRP